MSQNVGYQVGYTTPNNYLFSINKLTYTDNVHPSENSASIVLAGIQSIQAAREIDIYRNNTDGTQTLQWRGMTTNVTYSMDSTNGVITTITCAGLWHMLDIRLMQIYGIPSAASPVNTNPYTGYLNQNLQLTFGPLFKLALYYSFTQAYTTGYLPSIVAGPSNPTSIDSTVVNDNLYFQYVSVSSFINRLWSSALFSQSDNSPYTSEVKLDITQTPLVMSINQYDPAIGYFGVGQNKSGTTIGGAAPVDNIFFIEGQNFTSISLTYDYESMGNSFVLTGGNFEGSQVVALNLDNPESIFQYGLKQQNQSLGNVVDTDEIQRYIHNAIPYYQRPLPNLIITPIPTYASYGNYPVINRINAGDIVSITSPTFAQIVVDSNGNPISIDGTTSFYSRIRQRQVSWDADNGEVITYSFMFPIGTTPQFMYKSIGPSAKTLFGAVNQQLGYSLYNSSGSIANSTTSTTFTIADGPTTSAVAVIVVTIPALVMNYQTQNNEQSPLIYGMFITIAAADPTVTQVKVVFSQPDGAIVYNQFVPVGQQINVLSLPIQVRNSSGNLLPVLTGNWMLSIFNAQQGSSYAPLTEDYTVTVQYSYVQNPSTTKIAVTAPIAQPGNPILFDPTEYYVTPP